MLVCFGTVPEYLKIKPILPYLDNYKLLFTGQHPDLLKDVEVDFKISISKGNRLDNIVASCLRQFPPYSFKGVLVQGDTASAFACALAAFHRKIPIFYVEAGLRTYDLRNPYPEEGYRQMISRIADYNFHPTELGANNHAKERLNSKGFVVGNTALDNLKGITPIYSNIVLCTLHRRENLSIIDQWFKEINNLAEKHEDLNFIIPLHPNPEVQKHKHLLTRVDVCDRMEHNELLKYLSSSRLVITDSGGIQEEGSFFNKRVIVCRKETERPEGMYTGHITLCKEPNKLKTVFNSLVNNYKVDTYCPYGDGKSGKRIAEICNKILS